MASVFWLDCAAAVALDFVGFAQLAAGSANFVLVIFVMGHDFNYTSEKVGV